MDKIKAWLNSPNDYDAGVQLYLQYGTNATMKRVLSQEAETAFKRQKLKDALQQLVAGNSMESRRYTAPSTPNTSPSKQQLKGWPALPIEDPVLLALHNHWRPLYGELKSLQHRIDEIAQLGATDRNKAIEAGQMAIQILSLEEQTLAIYAQRDYYYQHQKLPYAENTADDEVVDPLKWPLELETHKRYVRRYTKKIADDPNNKNVPNWAKLLKKSMDLVVHYKKLLKLDE